MVDPCADLGGIPTGPPLIGSSWRTKCDDPRVADLEWRTKGGRPRGGPRVADLGADLGW